MGVSSYIEFITTLFGWIMYDNIWSVLADSGVIYIPFIAILVSSIAQAKKAGDDEGSPAKQSLKNVEVDLLVGIMVMFIAAIPFTTVQLGNMQYVRPTLDCNATPGTVIGTNTNTSYDSTLATISGQSGRIPIWWGFVHTLTKSIVSASIASIPCTGDMSAVNFQLENDAIEDPRVRREYLAFLHDCHMPAKSKFIRKDPSGLAAAQWQTINYPGSSYFLTTPGYYDTFYQSDPNPNFPFNAVRDAGYEFDAPAGHPTCAQWWSDPNVGIRKLLLNEIEQRNKDEYVYNSNNLIQSATPATLSTTQREDVLLQKFVGIKNTQLAGGNLSVSYHASAGENGRAAIGDNKSGFDRLRGIAVSTANFIVDAATVGVAAWGAAKQVPSQLAAGIAVREGAPIFLSMLLMIFICILPFLMVFSLYRLETLMTLTLVFFGLNTFYLLWGIAFWVDNHFVNAITQGSPAGYFSAVSNPMQTTMIIWMQRFLYIIFPVFWVSALGWVGFRTMGLASQFSTLTSGAAGSAEKAGDAGAGQARNRYAAYKKNKDERGA